MTDDEHQDAEKLGHEPITVNARVVTKGFVVLFAVVIAALLLMAGLMMILTKWDGGAPTVDAPDQVQGVPSGVAELDANQRGSLRALRKREKKVLTEYSWLDPNAGIARIPIKRAMEIMSQLPATSSETQE